MVIGKPSEIARETYFDVVSKSHLELEAGFQPSLARFCQNRQMSGFRLFDRTRGAPMVVMDFRDAKQPPGMVRCAPPPYNRHFQLRSVRPRDTLILQT